VIGAAANDARTEPLEIRSGGGSVRLTGNFPRAIWGEELAEIFAPPSARTLAAMPPPAPEPMMQTS